MQDMILPFQCPYTDCSVYCYTINKELVDFMNDIISTNWQDLLEYLSNKIINLNGEFIELNDDETFIKYIMYASTYNIYADKIDMEYGCYATFILVDDYFIISGDGNKTNVFVLVFDDNKVSCHLETNCIL